MSLAVPAIGLLAYTSGDATDGKIVTVGTVTYTLKTGALSAAGHVAIVAGEPAKTARNLAYALNGSGGVVGTDYYTTPANGAAKAQNDAVEKVVRVEARVPGAAGNTIALTTNEPEFTAPGSLAGGIDGTAIVPWSLVTLAELKIALRVRGDDADEELTALCAEVTDLIEREVGFRLVADIGDSEPEADLDEYHDLANPQGFLYLRRRPVRSVSAVYLGGSLISSSDYVLDYKSGLITLLGAAVTRPSGSRLGQGFSLFSGVFTDFPEDVWRYGSRYFPATQSAGRVLYKGGWATTETVDPNAKGIMFEVAARIYRNRERKSQGVSSEIAQGFSTATKYDPKAMNEDIRARLRAYKTFTATARE